MTDTGIWAAAAANSIIKMCPVSAGWKLPENSKASPRRICRCTVPTKLEAKILIVLS
jgi:hypothetical protein